MNPKTEYQHLPSGCGTISSTELAAQCGRSHLKLLALLMAMGAVTAQAASLDVDFQATIASEQHPSYPGEAQFYHVSTNPANPGTGSYAATIVGTNNPAPPFVRNFDGPVVAYKFAGGANDDITAVAQSGGTPDIITFSTTDATFDGFGQQQAKIWTSTDPGPDIQAAGADPYNEAADASSTGGWRSLGGATGTIDITLMTEGSVHIYYGAFGAKPTVSVVMRDTDGLEPDITITDAHSIADGGNDDTANRTEYYLAEIDFVNDLGYDEIEFVWNAGGTGNGRGIGVVVTGPAPADPDAPTLAPADIVDGAGGGPIFSDGTPLTYTVTYSELMDPATIGADDFEILGTGGAGGTIESVAHYGGVTTVNVLPTVGTSGTIQLQVKATADLKDLAGNALNTTSAIADDTTITVNPDNTPPTVVSFDSPPASGTIYGTPTITYTVTFSEYVNPLASGNFTNAGNAPFSIGTVTDSSPGAPTPSVYTVEVIPSGTGTIKLEVQGTVEDLTGNSLAVPVTDTVVYTLDTEPARETVTLDASITSPSESNPHDLIFDASASDKLVVIVTGENGFPGLVNGKVNSITYDGIALTQAVGRLPIDSPPSAYVDQLYNDIWYLDDPAAATALEDAGDSDLGTPGNISASLVTRGVITAIRLSGTAPGVGATVISDQEVKSVSLITTRSGSIVLASHGMGGDGNTANVGSVNTDPAPAELSAVSQGGSYNGHVTSQTSVASPSQITAIFTGGNTVGTHTIVAEFQGALVGAGTPFENWAGGTGAGLGFGEDKNGDGVDNGMAFLLGAADPDANALGLLPTPTDDGSGGLVMSFTMLDSASRGTAALTVQWSNDLGVTDPWSANQALVPDATPDPQVAPVDFQITGSGTLNVVAAISSSEAAGGKLFGRMEATE